MSKGHEAKVQFAFPIMDLCFDFFSGGHKGDSSSSGWYLLSKGVFVLANFSIPIIWVIFGIQFWIYVCADKACVKPSFSNCSSKLSTFPPKYYCGAPTPFNTYTFSKAFILTKGSFANTMISLLYRAIYSYIHSVPNCIFGTIDWNLLLLVGIQA